MGGGGGGGMGVGEQRFNQRMQMQMQQQALEVSKKQLENAKLSVVEPVKSAENAMTGATDATEKAAQLRKGIASTFNRPTAFSAKGGNTSGTATKLGD